MGGGVKLVGAFLGPDEWVSAQLLALVNDKLIPRMQRVKQVAKKNLQVAVRLIQSVYQARVTHLLRTHTPRATEAAAKKFDEAICQLLQDCVGSNGAMGKDDLDRALLPLRLSGLGLGCAVRRRWPAFLASLGAVLHPEKGPAVQQPLLAPMVLDLPGYFAEVDGGDILLLPRMEAFREAHQHVAGILGWDVDAAVGSKQHVADVPYLFGVKHGQRFLSQRLEDAAWNEQFNRPDERYADADAYTEAERAVALVRKQAWWLSSMGAGAAGVFTVGPRDLEFDTGVNLNNAQFRFAIELQLYLPLSSMMGLPKVCSCSDVTRLRGYHYLKCRDTDANTERHDNLNYFIARMLRRLSITTIMEPLNRYPENEKKRADGECPHLLRFGPTEYDILITTPLSEAGSFLRNAAYRPGHAAEIGEKRKINDYKKSGLLRRTDGVKFFPLVLENGGRRGKKFTEFLQAVAERAEPVCPRWRFYLTVVPKMNAIHVLGLYNKCMRIRNHIRMARDNRVRHRAPEGG